MGWWVGGFQRRRLRQHGLICFIWLLSISYYVGSRDLCVLVSILNAGSLVRFFVSQNLARPIFPSGIISLHFFSSRHQFPSLACPDRWNISFLGLIQWVLCWMIGMERIGPRRSVGSLFREVKRELFISVCYSDVPLCTETSVSGGMGLMQSMTRLELSLRGAARWTPQ